MFDAPLRICILLSVAVPSLAGCDRPHDQQAGQVRILNGREAERVPPRSSRQEALPATPRNAPAYDPSRTPLMAAPLDDNAKQR